MLIPLQSTRPTRKAPLITSFLILTNVVLYLYQFMHDRYGPYKLPFAYGAIPYELTRLRDLPPELPYPVPITLITSMFLHGGVLHLVGNMLYLHAFGSNIEDAFGHLKFLVFYLLCGVLATLSYVILNFNSRIPLVGASGAIAGIMGAHFLLFPGARIKCLLLFFIVLLPAVVVILPWIIIQIFNLMSSGNSQIAFIAHVTGFFVGMLLTRRFKTKWILKSTDINW
jgi:membrane associated rhomboid family serine protease